MVAEPFHNERNGEPLCDHHTGLETGMNTITENSRIHLNVSLFLDQKEVKV